MLLSVLDKPAIWTSEALHLEKDRRLAEDLTALGRRPSWWRPRARRRYDRAVRRLKKAHGNDLRVMLAAQDPRHRALLAHLTGWKLPTEGHRG